MTGLEVERARLAEVYRRRARSGGEVSLDDPWEQHQRRVRFALFEQTWQSVGDRPLASCAVLEIGCGRSGWLIDFADAGASELAGIDLVAERLEDARRRLPSADLRIGCASALPWESERFDLVVVSTVLSSIQSPALRAALGREAQRVARPGGWALVFDLRWPSPRGSGARRVSRREVEETFAHPSERSRSLLCFPPLGRRLVRRVPRILGWLERCSLLHTHRMDLLPLTADTRLGESPAP